MPRPDAKVWLSAAISEARDKELPYIVKWPDGTYNAMSLATLQAFSGKFLLAASVSKLAAALERGEQIVF